MEQGNITTSSGIGFFGALQVLLIGLKLGAVIAWPWWKVLLPFEIETAVFALFVAGLFAVNVYRARDL